MNWCITIETQDEANTTPRKQTLKVKSGHHTSVFNGEDNKLPTCTAVACIRPERLALVFGTTAGVRLNGRPVRCPVVAISTRGGKLSLEVPGRNVTLDVSSQGNPALTTAANGVCSLCHDPLMDGAAAQCPRCGRRFHSDCLQLQPGDQGCVACSEPTKQRR